MSSPHPLRLLRRRARVGLLLGSVAALTCSRGGAPVRIGLAVPSDDPRGESMRLAAELAVREINAAGGMRNRQLELVVGDDGAKTEQAVTVARTFYDDPTIVAVVGHLTSGATLAAAPVYNGGDQPLPAISPSASNPAVSEAGPYTFRVCPTDLVHGARLAAWAVDRLRAARAAVLYLNDEYGRGVRGVFTQEFTARGGRIVADDPYLDDLPSLSPYLERLRRNGGADVLMVAGTRAGGERTLRALEALGWRVPVMGGDGMSGIEAIGAAAEGVYVSTAYLPDRPGDRNAAFVRAYQTAYGGRLPDHRGAGAYDAVYLLAQAIREAGPDRARIRDYLAGLGTQHDPFDGVTGPIRFDRRGDVPDKDVVIGIVRAGRLVTAGDAR